MNDFETKISELDISLFDAISSQSTDSDKESLLALQLAVRELTGNYNYLEIGSHLGGSIQPYLFDKRCSAVYSIDKRPEFQPDERGLDYNYRNNSTGRMIEMLREVSPEGVAKITAIDGDTRETDSAVVKEKIHLCFIDGEHTDKAVFSDFRFCLDVLDKRGAIVFHDTQIVYNGVAMCLDYLENEGVSFKSYNLPSILFVVEIGDFSIHRHAKISELLLRGREGYLFSLQNNDEYRVFANKKPFLLYRRLIAKLKGSNRFE